MTSALHGGCNLPRALHPNVAIASGCAVCHAAATWCFKPRRQANRSQSRRATGVLSTPLQVARCTKIINPGTDEAKYVINVKQIAKVGWTIEMCVKMPRTFGPTLLSDRGALHHCEPLCVWHMQFVVGLGDKVAPTDIEEGMRVGCVTTACRAS
jgi:hypothetical protein